MKTLLLILAVAAPLWVFAQTETPAPAAKDAAVPLRTMQYDILASGNERHLQELVSAAIKQGWRPLGGVATSDGRTGRGWLIHQAVIRGAQ